MVNELSLWLLLSNNSRRKRQIKQRTLPLKVQEAIPAVEYNDLEAAIQTLQMTLHHNIRP